MIGKSNLELLNETIDNITDLTRRGVIPDTHEGYAALKNILDPIAVSEWAREEEIAASEEEAPNEHDPEEPVF